jgi:hypothetical protein
MYRVRFIDRSEIRMGSPFNLATPVITGDYIPDLSEYDFQDVAAISPDGNHLFVVFWDLHDNSPAFRVLWLNERKRLTRISDRIPSACRELIITSVKGAIRARVWNLHDGEHFVDIIFPEH